jgi:hypothetical protein
LDQNVKNRLFVTSNMADAEDWAERLYDNKYPAIFRINDADPASFKPDERRENDTDAYTTEPVSPDKIEVLHAKTGWTPLSAHSPETWKKVKSTHLDPFEKPKGQLQLFPTELYTEGVRTIVDQLLEVNILPASGVNKTATGWDKTEAPEGDQPLTPGQGVSRPRVNLGMKTPTTTFLPFAGFSPIIKRARHEAGENNVSNAEDLRLVPGAESSATTLLKIAPKSKGIGAMSEFAGITPAEFSKRVGVDHLIILGPTSAHKHGREAQTSVLGHEAGHVINGDTQRYSHAAQGSRKALSDDEVISSEEKAWDTGDALLKDMGVPHSPHERKPALHTYYSNRDRKLSGSPFSNFDITDMTRGEQDSLLHTLKRPEVENPNAFRVGSDTYKGPADMMKKKFGKALGMELPED